VDTLHMWQQDKEHQARVCTVQKFESKTVNSFRRSDYIYVQLLC